MTRCLESDTLVSLVALLGADVERALGHAAECEACRTALAELALVRDAVAADAALPPHFVDRVWTSMAMAPAATTVSPSPPPSSPAAGLVFALASLLLYLGLATTAGTAGQVAGGAGLPVLALLGGTLVTWWSARRMRSARLILVES